MLKSLLSLLVLGAVVHGQRRFGVLDEELGALVARIGLGQPAEAVGRLVVLVVVFVQHAEVVEHALADRRILEAALVEADGLVVVPLEVVQEAEAEERRGVSRFEFDGPLVVLGRARHVAFGLGEAAFLVVVFGVVRRRVLELGEDRFRFANVPLEPQDAGTLQLNLLGGVAGLLGPLERLDRGLVVVGVLGFGGLTLGVELRLTEGDVRLPEPERGERSFGFLQVFDRGADVAEEVVGDAELEMELLLLWTGGDGEPLVERVENVLEVANLRSALSQPFAELGHHPAFKIFALDQERPQIDEGFRRRHVRLLQADSRPSPDCGKEAKRPIFR